MLEFLWVQFLEGVAFLNERKIVHLDLLINPNNIIVEGQLPSSLQLFIIDFGLSLSLEDGDTVTRGYCGTRSFRGLLQRLGHQTDPQRSIARSCADR